MNGDADAKGETDRELRHMGCLFDGCFGGAIGCLPVALGVFWLGVSIWHVV